MNVISFCVQNLISVAFYVVFLLDLHMHKTVFIGIYMHIGKG
jgi:hypothetical protein